MRKQREATSYHIVDQKLENEIIYFVRSTAFFINNCDNMVTTIEAAK